jgi:hypothetical protein
MHSETWRGRLQTLCVRFSHLGMDTGIAALSLIEKCGLYLFLSSFADG